MVIPIALPEITHDRMIGFLDDEYKIRSLNHEEDIVYIYDAVVEKMSIPQSKVAVIHEETRKLKIKYESYLSHRVME